MLQGCYEETASVEFKLYGAFMSLITSDLISSELSKLSALQ